MALDSSLIVRRRKKIRRPRFLKKRRRLDASWVGSSGSGGGGGGTGGTGTTDLASTWTEPARASTWTAPTMTILVKRQAESRTYTMSFANLPEISSLGQTLASVTSVVSTVQGAPGATNLTLGTPSVSGTACSVQVSGGQDGVLYELEFTVVTNGSPAATLVGIGYLLVEDE
jgi:hypothetical protein